METLQLEVPIEFSAKLLPYRDRLPEVLLLGLQQLKIQEALLLYSRGLVSFGRAAELSGLPEREMIRHARASGMQPRWTEELAKEELQ
ncbi:UPF0175 family protein [candidate division KSB1 bacterium]|nr:UPF0175 family protein [candidate division KSB1 bacterium]